MSEYVFIPKNEPQRAAFADKSPNLLFDGPWGTGKTHVGAAKGFFLGCLYKNNCIAFVRKKRVDLKATLWKWFIDKILEPSLVIAHNDTELYRKIRNGTEFFGVGLDSENDVNKLASREYGFIVVEEAVETDEQDFEEKLGRCLRLTDVPFHQLMLITNPGMPGHYIHQKFITDPMPGYKRVQGVILPDLPNSYYDRVNQLTGLYRLRYKDGKWAAFEGLVYPFDPGKHIVKRFEIPRDWRRVLAVDFGFDHPFVCQWWAISPSDRWYMYREIYHTRRTVAKHAPDIKKYCKEDGIEPMVFCDHDAEDAATLRENGIYTELAKKDRLAGQQSVFDLFDQHRVYFMPDSLVELDQRLVMEKRPQKTVDEFGFYIWANKQKEDMIKEKDDGMDTMRYAIHTEAHRIAPRARLL